MALTTLDDTPISYNVQGGLVGDSETVFLTWSQYAHASGVLVFAAFTLPYAPDGIVETSDVTWLHAQDDAWALLNYDLP